ncbi:MAG TPA: DUF6434 domain-containing protein [Stellaceae bacterium]|nr:DUF6434 domain-containing protein [Stellaceae bacterium]
MAQRRGQETDHGRGALRLVGLGPGRLIKVQCGIVDWHGSQITRATPITKSYRNTQKVRRFFKAECGDGFKLDRTFMAWLKDGKEKTMGEAADEWLRRVAIKRQE